MSEVTAPAFDTSRQHAPMLDGVRGIAVLMVLLYHVRGPIPQLAGAQWLNYPLYLFSPLWSGVDLFFALSGFLITNILLRARAGPHYFRNFYARRTLRIFPLYYFTLGLHVLAQHGLPFVEIEADAGRLRTLYWLYAQNWLSGLQGESLRGLEHYWSLAVEEQFYLVWPLAVLSIKSPRVGVRVCASSLVFCLVLRAGILSTGSGASLSHFSTITRLDSLLVGALIAYGARVFTHDQLTRWGARALPIGAIGFVACVLSDIRNPVYDNTAMQTVGYTSMALFSAGLITLVVGRPQHRLSQSMNRGWLRSLGKYGYGIYVYHWPVMLGVRHLLEPFAPSALAALLYPLLSAALTLGLSMLSYRLLERPFLTLKRHFAVRPEMS